MPQAIATFLTPLLITAGLSAASAGIVALSPLGADATLSEDEEWFFKHVWPQDVFARTDLAERLCSRAENTSALKGQTNTIVAALVRAAAAASRNGGVVVMPDNRHSPLDLITRDMRPMLKEMDAERSGSVNDLLNDGAWPHMAFGRCLDPVVAEGSLMFSNSRLDIRKGDIVAIAAHGLPMAAAKVYLGEGNGHVFFWCNQPSAVYVFEYRHLIHISRISHIKTLGKPLMDARQFDFKPFLSVGGRKVITQTDDLPFIAPKAKDIIVGLNIAHAGIVRELAALPAPSRSVFGRLVDRLSF